MRRYDNGDVEFIHDRFFSRYQARYVLPCRSLRSLSARILVSLSLRMFVTRRCHRTGIPIDVIRCSRLCCGGGRCENFAATFRCVAMGWRDDEIGEDDERGWNSSEDGSTLDSWISGCEISYISKFNARYMGVTPTHVCKCELIN